MQPFAMPIPPVGAQTRFKRVPLAIPELWHDHLLQATLDAEPAVSAGLMLGDMSHKGTLNRKGLLCAIFLMGLASFYDDPEEAIELMLTTALDLQADRTPGVDLSELDE